jgi:hypothetical protein
MLFVESMSTITSVMVPSGLEFFAAEVAPLGTLSP